MGTWQVFCGGCLGEPTAVMCTPPLNRHQCLGVGLARQYSIGRVQGTGRRVPRPRSDLKELGYAPRRLAESLERAVVARHSAHYDAHALGYVLWSHAEKDSRALA
jgi:hypothetical protein